VTPTGAALVRVLSAGPPPAAYRPLASGYGAGTKDFPGRANALRIILADSVEQPVAAGREALVTLASDVDDMPAEYLAAFADAARDAGALDVVLLATTMKKGRPGIRLEILCRPDDAGRLEALLLHHTTAIGVRRTDSTRLALPRREISVSVLGETIRLKEVTLPDGSARAKPEFQDVERVALATGRRPLDIYQLALAASERR
jgi:uncharacterized protein (DUF111 family)